MESMVDRVECETGGGYGVEVCESSLLGHVPVFR